MSSANADLAERIRTIPDFPKPGIKFRDITTLLLDAEAFHAAAERLAASVPVDTDLIAGVEARGFIFSSAAATLLRKGLVLIRKDGKLPGATIGIEYALEYGTDRIVMHEDACLPGQKVLLVDDLIATGGTALAAVRLLRRAGAEVVGASFVIDLPELGGAQKLREAGVAVSTLVSFDGD